MGDQVTIIDYDAFYNCENLKTLTLSARLEYIELGTILNHSNNRSQNIESIYLRAPIPPEIDNIDRNINASDLRIYVPSESVESYKSSRGWSDLKDYIYAYDYTDLPEINGYYYSTDYSRDGQLTIVQTATDGDGIDLIFMGKAFSDRQIADGTYSNAMQQGIDAFFSQEPFKSFKNLFNIYIIDAVSYSEKYIDDPIIDYTWPIDHLNKAFPKLDFNIVDSNIIIIINTPKDTEITAQTSGPISYVPLCDDTALFNKQILHEAGGHGFAKLADEDFDEHNEFPPIGTYDSYLFESDNKNIDITNDPNTIKWSHFLNDERYSSDGVGIYEGAIGYSKGVYRPSENSIMRNYTGGFNAPSREAIYYQIHRLAYGRNWEYNWEYNYEDFVEYDAINRGKQNQE